MKIYVIGSLRSTRIIPVTLELEQAGFEVFSDWFGAGPEADDHWMAYEKARGRRYRDALTSPAAENIFEFDKHHLDTCELGVLVYPAGKSAHTEMGYLIGSGKACFILMDEPGPDDRWDVMLRFATGIAYNTEELVNMAHTYMADVLTNFQPVETV